MRVALTGVSGFIGSVIARHLKEAGHEVTGLVRSSSRRDHITPWVDRFVVGDQADESCWEELLDDAGCVIHNSVDWQTLKDGKVRAHLETNIVAAINLLHASAPRQFIYMSSVAVHHDMRPRWRGQVDEDHPTRPGSLYGAAKAAVEAHLWAAHFADGRSTCALRPCAVYGPDPRLERTIGYPIVTRLRKEGRYDRPGGGKFVHVDDVAAATVAAVGNADADGRVFNLADCYARWSDWASVAAELLGIDADIDASSPPASKNQFTKDAVREALGVHLDRGREGIREALRELISRIDS